MNKHEPSSEGSQFHLGVTPLSPPLHPTEDTPTPQGASEKPQSGDKPSGKQVDTLSPELREALVALGWMYIQYCGANYGHNFMGAGEDAIEILEKYGLGDERKGVDEVALENLERGSDLPKHSPEVDAKATLRRKQEHKKQELEGKI